MTVDMDDGRQWQLTLQRLRHQAKRLAGDPGESDEDKQRYRSRFKHEFETLVAAELSKLEAATESAFTDAWSASQEADRAKFERDVAVHTEAIRRAASDLPREQPGDSEAPTKGPGDCPWQTLEEPLLQADRDILQAMLEIDAIVSSPKSAEEITRQAIGRVDRKRGFGRLRRNGLVEVKIGRGGGYWLTEKGLRVARYLA
ncbi:hypothetical protein U8335_23820 [Roseiconus lacunae]|uniref:hypothetical protein n=1 Tax=Roseiconus lacunae TaxID=2605694 RepID=UPI0030860788|nr:hypothetical protein U8335_23820 [Stieleria sp. HD01]